MLGMVLSSRRWLLRDIIVESCWRWRYQGDVGHGVISLPSHAGDGTAEATLAMTLPMTLLM
jgi:hypothetical protein